jgi:hypothetical protein
VKSVDKAQECVDNRRIVAGVRKKHGQETRGKEPRARNMNGLLQTVRFKIIAAMALCVAIIALVGAYSAMNIPARSCRFAIWAMCAPGRSIRGCN